MDVTVINCHMVGALGSVLADERTSAGIMWVMLLWTIVLVSGRAGATVEMGLP